MSRFSLWKQNARDTGREFTLSIEDVEALWISQKGLCALTGQPMIAAAMGRANSHQDDVLSLDRIDSARGYVAGNVWLTRWIANRIKSDLSMVQFQALCEAVIGHTTTQAPPVPQMDKSGSLVTT